MSQEAVPLIISDLCDNIQLVRHKDSNGEYKNQRVCVKCKFCSEVFSSARFHESGIYQHLIKVHASQWNAYLSYEAKCKKMGRERSVARDPEVVYCDYDPVKDEPLTREDTLKIEFGPNDVYWTERSDKVPFWVPAADNKASKKEKNHKCVLKYTDDVSDLKVFFFSGVTKQELEVIQHLRNSIAASFDVDPSNIDDNCFQWRILEVSPTAFFNRLQLFAIGISNESTKFNGDEEIRCFTMHKI